MAASMYCLAYYKWCFTDSHVGKGCMLYFSRQAQSRPTNWFPLCFLQLAGVYQWSVSPEEGFSSSSWPAQGPCFCTGYCFASNLEPLCRMRWWSSQVPVLDLEKVDGSQFCFSLSCVCVCVRWCFECKTLTPRAFSVLQSVHEPSTLLARASCCADEMQPACSRWSRS